MIKHCVFMNCIETVDAQTHQYIQDTLQELQGNLCGMLDFGYGQNADFEAKSGDYDIGFVISFSDKQALDEYIQHPTHEQLGARLVSMSVGGADGIMVFDIQTLE